MSNFVRLHRQQPTGSPIPGFLQARTLELVAIFFSNAWKWKVKGKSLSRVRLLATLWIASHQASPSMGFSRQEYWSGVPLPSPFSCSRKSKNIRNDEIKKSFGSHQRNNSDKKYQWVLKPVGENRMKDGIFTCSQKCLLIIYFPLTKERKKLNNRDI